MLTRSSATAEKQRVSCAYLYLDWLSDRAMHRTPQNRRGCIMFWHSNALIQEVLTANGFWRQIATQGHSRSFILQSVTGRQGVAWCHIILLATSLKFSKTCRLNRQKLPSSTTPNVGWRHDQDEPPRISAWTLYFQKLESLAYIFVADSRVYIHSNLCSGLQKTHILQHSAGRKRILTSNSHSRSL